MIISDIQKNFCISILNKDIVDIESFLEKFGNLKKAKNMGANFSTEDFGYIKHGIDIFIPKDEESLTQLLKEFIGLWNLLIKNNLVVNINVKKKNFTPIFTKENKNGEEIKPNFQLMSIIKEYWDKEIVFLPEFQEFIKNDFTTNEEMYKINEENDRKEAQKFTRKIAYISIFISILISVITMIFNYLTYIKDRIVTISNPNAFADTLQIKIIEFPKDTSNKVIKNVPNKRFNTDASTRGMN